MNDQPTPANPDINLGFSGQLTVSRQVVESLIRNSLREQAPQPESERPAGTIDRPGKLPRLAYPTKETAEILGVCSKSIYRLIDRGLLRSSSAIRTKLISRKEIERFLSTV